MYVPCSLPQEDSDYERERTPPTPPPRKPSGRRGASLRLGCIGRQESDENPLMKRVAGPLKLAQSQVGLNVSLKTRSSLHTSQVVDELSQR